VETHVLSNHEMLELLYQEGQMGSRKPSQLLSAMLQNCPRGEERNVFFHFMFLQRLPASLRSLLGEVDHGDPRALAARADRLWSVHSSQHGTVAAATASGENLVAAVSSAASGRGKSGHRGKGRGASRPPRGTTAASNGTSAASTLSTRAQSPAPSDLARSSTGLCFYHWSFGEKARSCNAPCTWGN
jgi:hypothetical protein